MMVFLFVFLSVSRVPVFGDREFEATSPDFGTQDIFRKVWMQTQEQEQMQASEAGKVFFVQKATAFPPYYINTNGFP